MIAIDKGIVSRWKIDTRFENWLSYRADQSRFFKRLYIRFYAIFDREYYKKGKQMAKTKMEAFHAEKLYEEGHNENEILLDMLYCLHRFGFSYNEYFWFELYNKNTAGKEEFISDKMRFEYYEQLNSEVGTKLLRDKGKTWELLGDFFKRDCVAVYSREDSSAFQSFVEKHSEFLYKPIGLGCGEGVKKITATKSTGEQLCADLLKNGAFIVEEIICQSEEMAKFHRQSVNTVRIATMVCKDGVHALFSYLRMGIGDMIVDNAGAGGITAAVNPKRGIVVSKAISERGTDQYISHPDTKEKIIGFQLPEWDQALQLVKKMAGLVPNMRYIGWDLAYTDNGWVLVEANGQGQVLIQVINKIGIKYRFLELMENT